MCGVISTYAVMHLTVAFDMFIKVTLTFNKFGCDWKEMNSLAMLK